MISAALDTQRIGLWGFSLGGWVAPLYERTLIEWDLDSLAETARLLVSELVANAILHARSGLEVVMRQVTAAVRIEVHDSNARLPSQVLQEAPIGWSKSFAWGARSQKKLPDMLSLIDKRNGHSFIFEFSVSSGNGRRLSLLKHNSHIGELEGLGGGFNNGRKDAFRS